MDTHECKKKVITNTYYLYYNHIKNFLLLIYYYYYLMFHDFFFHKNVDSLYMLITKSWKRRKVDGSIDTSIKIQYHAFIKIKGSNPTLIYKTKIMLTI